MSGNEDIVKQRGTSSAYKDDRGSATLYPHPILGIVKQNIDPLRAGKIQVFLARLNGQDEDDPNNWTPVSYLSPFFGYTPNTASPDDYGTFVGNRNSYGFWATPPDLGTQVICIFINGDPGNGYYIGGIPQPSLTHMVPAIGATANVIPNDGEAESYGGADRLPVTEYNDADDKQANSSTPQDLPRPIHSFQTAVLNNQGLLRDPDRGAISSSAQRESPSRVFGMSTPGRPIFQGGYDNTSIVGAVQDSSIPDTSFKVTGRTGGHTFVMDDGDISGRDQLLRLRTSNGHMILMNDFAQTLFIIHANGLSYIELGKEGTIDMFSTNSVNIRTQGDLNLHADNNININAGKNLNVSATNINTESLEATQQFAGTTFKQFTKGDHTVKVNSKMSFESSGDSSIKSGGTNYLNGGPDVKLNTGASSLVPEEVKQLTVIAHTDTLRDDKKGYAPAPGKLSSIVSRAPAHAPWASANQGVDVKIDSSASSNLPASPSPSLAQVNSSVAGTQVKSTTPAVAATVPNVKAASSDVSQVSTSTLVSQMAVNASDGPMSSAVTQTAGVVSSDGQTVAGVGPMALTPTQLEQAGIVKPGADVAINAGLSRGLTLSQAMPPNVFTGKDGVSSLTSLVNNTPAQTTAATTLLSQSETKLKETGLITGKESITQKGGLMLAVATAGLGLTLKLAKNAIGGNGAPGSAALDALSSKLTAASGLGLKLPNPLADPKTALASGNAASNVADKSGPLGGVKIGDSLKGAVAGAFAKITGAFKALKGKQPQNLTVANAKESSAEPAPTNKATASEVTVTNPYAGLSEGQIKSLGNADPTDPFIRSRLGIPPLESGTTGGSVSNTLANTFDKPQNETTKKLANLATNALTKGGVPGIPGLLGGTGAVGGVVIAGKTVGLASVAGLVATVKKLAGSISKGSKGVKEASNGAKPALASKGGLEALASTGLDPEAAAEFQGAISSVGSPGSVEVKGPTVASNTFDFGGILAQSKSLLGDDKIPPLNLGGVKIPTKPLSADQVKEYDKVKAEIAKEEDNMWVTRKAAADAKYALSQGKGTQEQVDTTSEAYKASMQKVQTLREELGKIASGDAGQTA